MILATGSDPSGYVILGAIVLFFVNRWYQARTPQAQAQRDAAAKALKTVECPSCHEHKAIRVSGRQRVTSGVLGGLMFSRRARAQFQCGSCRYLW